MVEVVDSGHEGGSLLSLGFVEGALVVGEVGRGWRRVGDGEVGGGFAETGLGLDGVLVGGGF